MILFIKSSPPKDECYDGQEHSKSGTSTAGNDTGTQLARLLALVQMEFVTVGLDQNLAGQRLVALKDFASVQLAVDGAPHFDLVHLVHRQIR